MPASQWIAIAAMAENRVIGKNNTLPWHLPEDFKFFKEQTMGEVLVMGRKTFESIGKPLPGRETLVVTRQSLSIPGVRCLHSLDELRDYKTDKTLYICGGSEIYRQTLPECDILYLTRVKAFPEGDAHFPDFESYFDQEGIIRETQDFRIEKHIKNHSKH